MRAPAFKTNESWQRVLLGRQLILSFPRRGFGVPPAELRAGAILIAIIRPAVTAITNAVYRRGEVSRGLAGPADAARHIVTPNYCKRFNSRRRRWKKRAGARLITDSRAGVLYPITVGPIVKAPTATRNSRASVKSSDVRDKNVLTIIRPDRFFSGPGKSARKEESRSTGGGEEGEDAELQVTLKCKEYARVSGKRFGILRLR